MDPAQKLLEVGKVLLAFFAEKVAAVKFQSAHFEALGWQGIRVLGDLVKVASESGYFTILDAKRGDIGVTMDSYGRFFFDVVGVDAATVSPYMGIDVLEALVPWLGSGKGVYVLLATSNPSAGHVQLSGSNPIAKRIFKSVEQFARGHAVSENIGFVVGADKLGLLYDDELGHFPLLVPGVGAQGGKLGEVTRLCLASGGHLVPVSRSLTGIVPEGTDLPPSWEAFERGLERRCSQIS